MLQRTEEKIEDFVERKCEPQGKKSLNLAYLTDGEYKTPFPWCLCIFLCFLLGLTSFGLYLIHKKRTEKKKSVIIHCVRSDETLRSLAIRYYGNPAEWQKIFLANRKKLIRRKEGKLQDGEKLVIPISRQASPRIKENK
jgi:nucleoid-associated protein YgaU